MSSQQGRAAQSEHPTRAYDSIIVNQGQIGSIVVNQGQLGLIMTLMFHVSNFICL